MENLEENIECDDLELIAILVQHHHGLIGFQLEFQHLVTVPTIKMIQTAKNDKKF